MNQVQPGLNSLIFLQSSDSDTEPVNHLLHLGTPVTGEMLKSLTGMKSVVIYQADDVERASVEVAIETLAKKNAFQLSTYRRDERGLLGFAEIFVDFAKHVLEMVEIRTTSGSVADYSKRIREVPSGISGVEPLLSLMCEINNLAKSPGGWIVQGAGSTFSLQVFCDYCNYIYQGTLGSSTRTMLDVRCTAEPKERTLRFRGQIRVSISPANLDDIDPQSALEDFLESKINELSNEIRGRSGDDLGKIENFTLEELSFFD